MFSRRELLKASGTVIAASPLLAACAAVPPVLGGTDITGEAAGAFTTGAIALTAINSLIRIGTISKTAAAALGTYVNPVAGQLAVLHIDIDSGVPLTQSLIDQAVQLLNSLQSAAIPTTKALTEQHVASVMAKRKAMAKGVDWTSIVNFVIANLGTFISAGGALASLINELISEVKNISGGVTTAQADAAYNSWTNALADYNSLIA